MSEIKNYNEEFFPLWRPLNKTKNPKKKEELTSAQKADKRRKQLETERYKKKYFEFYDDVKISHREDW